MKQDFPLVTVKDRKALRAWLSENHSQTTAIWLSTYKKHHPNYLPWIQAVEELICWGWIDAASRKVDADRSAHLVAPRKSTSAWSAVNKDIVTRMRASGQMTEHGEAAIKIAKDNGQWSFLDDVERLEVPADLAQALGPLLEVWETYPRSVKRGTLEWVKTAKTEPTRSRRIEDIRASASQNLRPSIFRR